MRLTLVSQTCRVLVSGVEVGLVGTLSPHRESRRAKPLVQHEGFLDELTPPPMP